MSESSDDQPLAGDDPDSRSTVTVCLDDDLTDGPDPTWLQERLAAVVDQLGLAGCSLSVAIVGDAAMATLHERFTGQPGTTDVLTFDLREAEDAVTDPAGQSASPVDGEIYLCLDEARRRAGQFGHEVIRELLLYAVHGLLHLLGYDDGDPQASGRMHAKEDELLELIGVGRVYAVGERGGEAAS